MTTGTARTHDQPAARDTLVLWAERSGRRRVTERDRAGLRFAFYGRVSTEDHQDPVTSRARQFDQAAVLVAGFGWIVAEFFDVGTAGCCRGRAARRPPRCWPRLPTRIAPSTRL